MAKKELSPEEKMKTFGIRLPSDMIEWINSKGGAKWLRSVLTKGWEDDRKRREKSG